MNKRKNRIFAFFLAMTMLVSCMPATVFAEDKEGWSSDHTKFFYYNDAGELVASDVVVEKTIEATCENGTITVYKAKDTGDTDEVEADDALGHSYEKGLTEVIKEATCEKEGSHYRKCDRKGCDYVDRSKEIKDPALGHEAGEPVRENEKPATCVKAGSYDEVIYCTRCGEEISRSTKEISTTGAHDWKEENTEEKKPTCTEAGSVTVKKTCAICGETETETVTIDALGHDWKLEKTTKQPTCGKDGEGVYKCSRCNATETRPIPASGEHKFVREQIYNDNRFKAPTCLEKGTIVTAMVCQNCHEEMEDSREVEEVDALGHDYKVTSTNATCTESGQSVYTCSRCGDSYKTVDEALGHEFAKDKDGKIIITETVEKDATCTEEGVKILSKHCTRCGEDITEKDVIPAKGHTPLAPVKEVVKAPTCTAAGSHNEVVYCSVCKKVISSEKVVDDATGHKYGEAPVEQTCQGALYKCEKCGSLKKVAEEAIDHDWKLTKTTKAATCEEDGEGVYTCDFCGTTKEDSIPALGHNWSQTVKKPTCTEEGIAGGTCSRCKKMEEEVKIPALGHTFDGSKTTAKVYWDAHNHGVGYILYTTTCSKGCGGKKQQVENFVADEEGKKVEVKLDLMKDGEATTETASYTAKITKELTKEATCKAPGETTYTATVRHTLPNGKIVAETSSWIEKDIPVKNHTNGEAVKEKVVEANCAKGTDGSYELVVKCSVCGEEISRKKVTVKAEHTWPKEFVRENVKNEDSDTQPTTYDLVKYCTVCGKELVRLKDQQDPKTGHVPGETVKENIVEPDCKNGRDGSYDLVTYCKDCNPKVEISRKHITAEEDPELIGDHNNPYFKFAEYKYVYLKEATCSEKGTRQWVRYCTKCNEVLREFEIEEYGPIKHDAFFTKTVVTKQPTCTEEGASAEVTYCGLCFEEVKRGEETKIPATGHQWDAGVVTKAPTDTEKGEKTYTCLFCGETKTEEIDNSGLAKKESTIVLNNKLVYYNGKVQAFDATDAKVNGSKGAVTFEYFSDSKCTKKISAPKDCGNYYAKATVAADAGYAGATSSVAKLRILRIYQGFSVAGKTVTVSAASLKSANQMIPQSKAVTLRKGNDQVKFVKAIWTYNSPITVDRNGNIQLRKGLKAGTYTVKCKAFTPATRNYLRTVKVYTVTIQVK